MHPKQSFIAAIEGKPVKGRVPHFELVFFPTMEAFGKVHPLHRIFTQWKQMSVRERRLHIRDCASVYIQTARTYEHSAIFVHNCAGWGDEEKLELLAEIRDQSGDEFFLMIEGDATYAIPSGDQIVEFCEILADRPSEMKQKAYQRVQSALQIAERYQKSGLLDGFALCSDYCFNTGPFLSPAMFDEFITPYLTTLIAGYRQLGFYTIKHTDGNIMPILGSLISARPDALHSLDPQGGVDIAEVKQQIGSHICLIGNVDCSLLDTGSDEDVIESAIYALRHGMPHGRYIFSTSNCIYTGMRLERYELMLDVWKKFGNYSHQ